MLDCDSLTLLKISRKSAAALLAASAGAAALAFSLRAQQQTASPALAPTNQPAVPTSTLVVLDPAHGGSDSGATLGGSIPEKDVTLALASRIRGALTSSGFTVIATRDADPTDPLTTDQRAESANRTHALACIVLHATATGGGVHVYTSALLPPAPDPSIPDPSAPFIPIPWDSAQAKFVSQSRGLASALAAALDRDHLPALSAQTSIRPLDNLMCPAIAIEIAPLLSTNSSSTSPSDAAYQQQVAVTLTNALRAWRDQNQPASASNPNLDSQIAAQSRAIAAAEAAGRARAASVVSSSAPSPAKGQP
jgi:N-acetylmuramoyl-L-alanine amidase